MKFPNQKVTIGGHVVYYVYLPFNPQLIHDLNKYKKGGGGNVYMDYVSYFSLSFAFIKDFVDNKKFNDESTEALSNIDIIINTLRANVGLVEYPPPDTKLSTISKNTKMTKNLQTIIPHIFLNYKKSTISKLY